MECLVLTLCMELRQARVPYRASRYGESRSGPLSAYVCAMRFQVLMYRTNSAICLCACYGMPGTDILYCTALLSLYLDPRAGLLPFMDAVPTFMLIMLLFVGYV
eukprot:3054499-Rhodomonas_salina.2